jgi:hypothetical protein
MSKMKTEKKLVRRKLSRNRETLRSLSPQRLEEVAGGRTSIFPWSVGCTATCIVC